MAVDGDREIRRDEKNTSDAEHLEMGEPAGRRSVLGNLVVDSPVCRGGIVTYPMFLLKHGIREREFWG